MGHNKNKKPNKNNSNNYRREDGTFTEAGAEHFGEEGGEARKEQVSSKAYSKMGEEGANERWNNKEDNEDNDNS